MDNPRVWSVFDAKAKFSEVIEMALERGPQIVTRRGEPAVVILSVTDYEALKGPRPSFKEFLRKCPIGDLDLERIQGEGRLVDL